MRQLSLIILCLLIFSAAPAHAIEFSNVIIISIDALHPDALSEKIAPSIFRMMKKGSYTLKGKSVDPPKTLISHTAMITGLPPALNGKTDNDWKPGEARVSKETVFHIAKKLHYRTAYFYSKTKLGYLVNDAIDLHQLAPDDGIKQARDFMGKGGKNFVFLHISSLEYAGSESGWLSEAYLEAVSEIDAELAPFFDFVKDKGNYLLIITSDHAGHERLHGTQHPEDYKLPFVIVSDRHTYPGIQDRPYSVTELKGILEKTLNAK
ncbi:MAG: alkaline phosphatase [Nitrospirota bacterium]